jgi:hypothetical protein
MTYREAGGAAALVVVMVMMVVVVMVYDFSQFEFMNMWI